MDTLTERETEREDVPRRQDGSIDLNELARGLLEDCLNAVMSEQADELLGEGNRRNGYRERSLNTCVGRITLRIPKLREGTYFPDDVLRPYSRTDRAMVGAIAETYRLGLSESESESAPNPLTHRFPFRHDVGNGGNGGGYEHAIAQVHPRVQEARGRAVQVDGGRHLCPDRA